MWEQHYGERLQVQLDKAVIHFDYLLCVIDCPAKYRQRHHPQHVRETKPALKRLSISIIHLGQGSQVLHPLIILLKAFTHVSGHFTRCIQQFWSGMTIHKLPQQLMQGLYSGKSWKEAILARWKLKVMKLHQVKQQSPTLMKTIDQ